MAFGTEKPIAAALLRKEAKDHPPVHPVKLPSEKLNPQEAKILDPPLFLILHLENNFQEE